jgi:excisionase family DNA binding protein
MTVYVRLSALAGMSAILWSVSLTTFRPQLLTVTQAAGLLHVSDRTIRRWIETKKIPYLQLPSGGYRIPHTSLLASLRGTYDLARETAALDERFASVTEDQVRAALADGE